MVPCTESCRIISKLLEITSKVPPSTIEHRRAVSEIFPHGAIYLSKVKASLKDARQSLRDVNGHHYQH
jgi:hypothetical protein